MRVFPEDRETGLRMAPRLLPGRTIYIGGIFLGDGNIMVMFPFHLSTRGLSVTNAKVAGL